jgi:F-type H+-transporting ATPase subunit alpha
MTKALRLELAQYHELLSFAQFGTELDDVSQKKLQRGALAGELLKQPQFVTYNFVDQSLMLFLLKEDFLDKLDLKNVHAFATQFVSFVSSVHKELYDTIFNSQDITDGQIEQLKKIAHDFEKLFVAPER